MKLVSHLLAMLVVAFMPSFALSQEANGEGANSPEAIAESQFSQFPGLERFRLSNGMEVWFVASRREPAILMKMVVNTGVDEKFASRTPGAGEMVADLMLRGTTSRRGTDIISEIQRLKGGLLIAGGGEEISIKVRAPDGTLDSVIGMWADVIRNPKFDESSFRASQATKVDAARAIEGDQRSLSDIVVAHSLWGRRHPYSRVPTSKSFSALRSYDVKAFHRRWFGPNNASIFIVGNTTSDIIKTKLETAFGSWRKAPAVPGKAPDIAPATEARVIMIDAPGASRVTIRAASMVPAFDLSTEHAWGFFGHALSGRLFEKLRQPNIGANAYGSIDPAFGPRAFIATASVDVSRARDTLFELQRELVEVTSNHPITPAEFEEVRAAYLKPLRNKWETNNAVLEGMASMSRYGLSERYWDQNIERIQKLTLAEVHAAGNQLLARQKLLWVVVGDLSKIEADVRALDIGKVEHGPCICSQ